MKWRLWLPTVVLVAAALALSLFSSYPKWVEVVYSRAFYPAIASKIAWFTRQFGMSVGELLIPVLFLMALYCVYRMWRSYSKRRALRILVIAVNFMLCVFLLFQSLWGLNYSRLPLKESLQLDVHPRPAEEVYELAVWHVTKANQLCAGLDTETLPPQLDLWSGYENLPDAYAVFSRVKGRAKPLLSSVFFSYAGIAGIYNPFLAEPNYNAMQSSFMQPVTMAHEMAHLQGVAREDEANFIAVMVCLNHESDYVKYSGHMLAVIHLLNTLYDTDPELWLALKNHISQPVMDDLRANNDFWNRYDGWFEDLSTEMNNTYLKANGQADGVRSYGRMVDLLLASFEKSK